MTYGDFKGLIRKTASDKKLYDKAFNVAKDPKCDGCQHELASIVYKFFDKFLIHLQIDLFPVEQLKIKLCLIKN